MSNKTPRTPPSSNNKKLTQEKSISESDLSTLQGKSESNNSITLRGKRQRVEDSPPGSQCHHNSSVNIVSLKNDIMQMLTTWKTEQDIRFTQWKSEQDATLSLLTREVSDLKQQCQQIQKSNLEIEQGMEFINCNYEEMKAKICALEKGKKENGEKINSLEKKIQDMSLVTRSASIELRNIPLREQEKTSDLLSVVSSIGQAINLNVKSTDLRDIYRLPGRPGITRPIVAEFTSVSARNNYLSTVRAFNKERTISDKLSTITIGFPGDRKAIYVDEHLTPTLKKLLYEARIVAKLNNYSCWHANGKILMRTEKDSKPIHIKTEQCLTFLSTK
ncbi:unnamed protein product [Arctia plantaginis]|uniref:FP protein C-terminal domain-containing protein n=1 Tax=Arctia plantaginis TaxID=874455 RepID=A0A8S1B4M7_ARCPL|nr:unnamed protein product [Arctia plantaginis]